MSKVRACRERGSLSAMHLRNMSPHFTFQTQAMHTGHAWADQLVRASSIQAAKGAKTKDRRRGKRVRKKRQSLMRQRHMGGGEGERVYMYEDLGAESWLISRPSLSICAELHAVWRQLSPNTLSHSFTYTLYRSHEQTPLFPVHI